jgi:hypothetical protein
VVAVSFPGTPNHLKQPQRFKLLDGLDDGSLVKVAFVDERRNRGEDAVRPIMRIQSKKYLCCLRPHSGQNAG